MIEFTIVLLFASLFAACAEVVRNYYSSSVFNKWSYFDPEKSKHHSYRYGNPESGEMFFGSSDIVSLLWCGENLFRALMIIFLSCAVYLFNRVTSWFFIDTFLVEAFAYFAYRFFKWVLIR
jgi:hypothetical protein